MQLLVLLRRWHQFIHHMHLHKRSQRRSLQLLLITLHGINFVHGVTGLFEVHKELGDLYWNFVGE
jgi:hypothetical protein